MKWLGINNLGCTWEPKAHFVGSAAESKLTEYINLKEVEAQKSEKRKEDILAGKLVVSCKPVSPSNEPPSTVPPPKNEFASSRTRQNASIVWGHFNGGPGNKEKFYWDNSTTPASKRSICSLCNMHVSAASTTNLRTHLQSAHKAVIMKELKADETLEVGQCATLKSLKEDYGAVEKFTGPFKQTLDEQFVKWCCKKGRGLSIGETDRELKSWMLQATRGRYQPPTRKTAMDILLTMRVKAENTTKKLMMALRGDRVLPPISGTWLGVFTIFICIFSIVLFPLFRYVVMQVMYGAKTVLHYSPSSSTSSMPIGSYIID